MSEEPQQVPKIASIVHYVAYGTPGGEFPAGVHRAAIITAVRGTGTESPDADLCVLNPTGMFFNLNVPYDELKRPGTWHWPEP